MVVLARECTGQIMTLRLYLRGNQRCGPGMGSHCELALIQLSQYKQEEGCGTVDF